ncbi:MAG TPA: hypothetical protein VFS00_17480, partial [Polyangiaceae bacterium]|nr:hypothetical protein [Polyangiaceae bacterium]
RASLELLHAERLIRTCAEDRGFIEAYHDRVREIVLAHIAEDDRVAYHERLALALESSKHADPEVIAAHLRAARRFADAGRHALEAARRAEGALAFDRAVRLYRFALDCRPDAEQARALRAKLGRALANAGRGSEAAEAYLSVTAGAPPEEERTLRMHAAERYLAGGRMDEGYEVLRTLVEALGLGMPRTRQGALLRLVALRARMRLRGTAFRRRAARELPAADLARIDACWSIANAIGNLDTTRGLYFHGLNFLQALDAGEPYRVGRALSAEAAYGFILGLRSRAEAAELLARGRQIAEEFDDPYLLGVSFVHEGMIAFLGEEQWQKAWDLCQRGEAILRGHGTDVSYELTVAELYASNSLLFRGELAALAGRLGPALERAQDRQDLFAECYVRLRCGPLVNLAADRPEGVWLDLELLRERLRTREYYLQHYWRVHAEAQALLYRARPGAAAEAVARLDDEWPRLEPFLRTR